MTTMTFDRLAYIDRLKAAGVTEPQARAMADGLDQALREEVATKSDVAVLKSDIVAVRNEIDLLRIEVKNDLATLRGEFKNDLGALKAEMGGLRGELLAAMKAAKIDFLKWVVMLIVGQTAVFTALKLLGR
ncbi:MAG: CCDC90 family protein [Reyranella sp.]|nr:CCDC90 family protein [Reyranella sp.]